MKVTKLLVIAPHADDEVIGAGGLISKTLRGRGQVTVAIANGWDQARMSEAKTSAETLGGADIRSLVVTDGWLDGLPLHQLVQAVENLVDEIRPDCVLLPDPASVHQEHRAVAEAGMAALRPSGGTPAHRPAVVAYYEQAADVWRMQDSRQLTWFVELDGQDIDRKREAMARHESQVRDWPSERSSLAFVHLARVRGSQAGVDYAEAFSLVWCRS